MQVLFTIEKLPDSSGQIAERIFATIKAESAVLKDINAIGNLSEYKNLQTAIKDVKDVFGRLKNIKKHSVVTFKVETDTKFFSVTFFDKKGGTQAHGQYTEGDLMDIGVNELVDNLLVLKKMQAKENNQELFRKKLLAKKQK